MSDPVPAGSVGLRQAVEEPLEGSVRTSPPRDVLRMLAALSDENRYRIVELLSAAGGELPCSAISCELGLSPSLVSHHLSTLEGAGVIDRRKDGLRTMNGLRRTTISRHLSMLTNLLQ